MCSLHHKTIVLKTGPDWPGYQSCIRGLTGWIGFFCFNFNFYDFFNNLFNWTGRISQIGNQCSEQFDHRSIFENIARNWCFIFLIQKKIGYRTVSKSWLVFPQGSRQLLECEAGYAVCLRWTMGVVSLAIKAVIVLGAVRTNKPSRT